MLKWLWRSRQRTAGATAAPPSAAPGASNPDDLMRQAFPLHEAGRVDEAERLYHQILAIAPDYADAHYLLGRMAQEGGRYEEAIQHVRRALKANGNEPAFHRTLGEVYYALGLWHEALAYLHNAVERDPSSFSNWTNLGCAYEKLGKLAEAARYFDKALEIAPDSAQALNNCAMALKDRGRVPEAVTLFRKAKDRDPGDPDLFSNYLYALNFTTQHTPAEIYGEHLAYDKVFGSGRHGVPRRERGNADPTRKLRVGYFSPDLRSHPVSVFVEPVLRHHDRSRFEIHGYNLYPWRDQVSERLAKLCDHWVDCATMNDAQIAERIVEDRVDILVDLAGHTGHNRLAVLARKPAPVIATWLGYPNTTGLAAVDYRITDDVADPPASADCHHREKLVRLPRGQWCFLKPDVPLPVTPLPAARGGSVCFGSFNNASKVNEESLDLWADVLTRVPNSWLLIWGVGDEQRGRIGQRLQASGVAPARVEYSDRTPFRQQLDLYQRVDIALDTYPYSGVTTTFNALWMGVPVLTLAGDWLTSRSTYSILTTLGLADWGATSRPAYVETAVRKAGDLASLAQLRGTLRGRLEQSVLMDGKHFTQQLESAFRRMWESTASA